VAHRKAYPNGSAPWDKRWANVSGWTNQSYNSASVRGSSNLSQFYLHHTCLVTHKYNTCIRQYNRRGSGYCRLSDRSVGTSGLVQRQDPVFGLLEYRGLQRFERFHYALHQVVGLGHRRTGGIDGAGLRLEVQLELMHIGGNMIVQ
jgi:hypothetical protein